PPTPSSVQWPRRPCQAPRTSCFTTSWASATACGGCGATCAAGWAASATRWPPQRAPAARRSGPAARWRASFRGTAGRRVWRSRAPRVASSTDAHVTFLQLVDAKALPDEFLAAVRSIDYSSASLKINVALSELPAFRAVRNGSLPPNAHLRGTIHIAPTLDYME